MKKILIYAYMAGNLGDDLMVETLCLRYPDVQFRLWADETYKMRFSHLKNVKVISPEEKCVVRWNRFAEKICPGKADVFQLLVKKSDALVHIGGSIYVQHDNYQVTFALDKMLRGMSRRMYTVGANFGPYTEESYYRQYKELLSRYDGICFRDYASYQLFGDMSNVRYAPDVVFQHEMPVVEKRKKQALFSVIRLEDRKGRFPLSQYTKAYRKFMTDLAKYYIKKGYHVKFVSFCRKQGDEMEIERILEELSEDRNYADSYYYDKNIQECLRIFAESEIVIGTRFHSIILGWIAGCKVLPIIYDKKTVHLLEDMGCDRYLTMKDLESVDMEEAENKAEELPARMRKELKIEAEKQFSFLDTFLK